MKEIEMIIEDLKQCLFNKQEEISSTIDPVNAYTTSSMNNRKIEVALFEQSARNVTNDPFEKDNIIKNFRKGAEELKLAINSIEV